MAKAKKVLSTVLAALMLVFTVAGYVPTQAAKAVNKPILQMVTQPENKDGRVSFSVTSPNYGGQVEYRVILWNGTTKTQSELWPTQPGYYYQNWKPSGNYIFPIHWPVEGMEPGAYSLTVLVRRAGSKVSYDSFVKTNAFWIKNQEVTVSSIAPVADVTVEQDEKPVLPEKVTLNMSDKTTKEAKVTWGTVDTTKAGEATVEGTVEGTDLKATVKVVVKEAVKVESISAITDPSIQAIVGKNIDVKVKTAPNGVVVFNVGAPVGSSNTNFEKQVRADKDGVATLSYTRNTPDADTIVVYGKRDASVRTSVSKIYWGVKPILTVAADTATPDSNGTVIYTATLLNPVTGEPMSNRALRVVFAENIGKEGTHATATAAGRYGERLFQDVYGQSNTLLISTDVNGVAKFYVTGSHEAVTPIVFYDNQTFYTNVLYDSSQYLASFAGNNNGKFDARELNAKAPVATFTNAKYNITCNVTESGAYASTNYRSGKLYTVTVTDKDNKPLAGTALNVGIKEILSGYDSRARIIGIKSGATSKHVYDWTTSAFPDCYEVYHPYLYDYAYGYYKAAVKLDSKGQATFEIASDRINTTATPIVWIDGDTPERYTGMTNGLLDQNLDTTKDLPSVTFINAATTQADFAEVTGEPVPANVAAVFDYLLLNQNGDVVDNAFDGYLEYGPLHGSHITFVIANTGSKDIYLSHENLNAILQDIVVDQIDSYNNHEDIVIKPHQYRTVSGTAIGQIGLCVYSSDKNNGGASVAVTATAERNPYYVGTNDVKYLAPITATASFVAPVVKVEVKKTTDYDFVGKLDADVDEDGITVNIINNRFFNVNLNTALANSTQIYIGEVTSISDKVYLNDFSQATIVTDDKVGLTRFEKLFAVLSEGAAIQIRFSAVDPDTIEIIKVLHTKDMYNEDLMEYNEISLESATKAVVVAEAKANAIPTPATQLTVDDAIKAYNDALTLVNALPTSADKTALINRLNAVNTIITAAQAAIDAQAALANATAAVVKAEIATNAIPTPATQVAVDAASKAYSDALTLVNALPNGTDKTNLINRLVNVKTTIDAAQTSITLKAFADATAAVVAAETLVIPPATLDTQLKINAANQAYGTALALVNALPASIDKTLLANRLTTVLNTINAAQTVINQNAALAAVNAAADKYAMRTAIETNASVIGLNLAIYNTLSPTDKLDVATDMLAQRPLLGFLDLAAVKTAFENIVK